MTSRRPALALAGLALALGPVMSGCQQTTVGTAASVGDQRITITRLQGQIAELNLARSAAGGAGQTANPTVVSAAELQRAKLTSLVLSELFAATARRLTVRVTEGDVDALLRQVTSQAGGEEQLRAQALKANLAPSQIRSVLRDRAVLRAITNRLTGGVPATDQASQTQAEVKLVAALSATASDLGVSINPRYGQWDPKVLQVAPSFGDLVAPATPAAKAPALS
jgi:hypothetical protein